MTGEATAWEIPWRLFLAEAIGTGLLLLGGLSLVIFVFGAGSPVELWIPSIAIRRTFTGFLFGCVGSLIALSTVGKESGAHLNPAVTFGFWLMQKIDGKTAVGYSLAQVAGAVLGSFPLLLWGAMGRSIDFGATVPGEGYRLRSVLIGEAITTFGLIASLCVFLGARSLRRFTPFMIPFLYAVMVPLEASVSGTSTNPARTFGPAVLSGRWDGWWIYWVGPLIGALLAILVCSSFAKRIEVAKLYHFETDRRRLFHRMAARKSLLEVLAEKLGSK
ncbi:MAG TPA: aquaporin [Terriglobia bacterium]|nr:aquaporin [Terriglobia bacterium]